MTGSGAHHEALIRGLIAGLQQRDVAAVTAVLADDAVDHFPGRSPLAGTYAGKAAIAGVFQRIGRRLEWRSIRHSSGLDEFVA